MCHWRHAGCWRPRSGDRSACCADVADTPRTRKYSSSRLRDARTEPDAKHCGRHGTDPGRDARTTRIPRAGSRCAKRPSGRPARSGSLLAGALKRPPTRGPVATLEVIAQVGLGSLEPLVKDALLHARKRAYTFSEMYRMLSRSDDRALSAVFRQSLQQTEGEVSAFSAGSQRSRKPWLRGLLLGR